ncbi:hypothetical protein NCAS_0B03290 [Naumovozyma castellii]|uniref:Uncharacterized protein n=1 Tax=Naumovozyma castellii TaxID=27288 RepID=G0VBT7_NAUCA|nr:hypothetical protein NCAS_0B03290 [Naumovozyma castellii CBS 4309]CCC68413.1 hypothetical protein NCAS_0B03290 [Naumovozyma castellii CBS 4309]
MKQDTINAKLIATSSPEGLAAANMVTPSKLSHLLLQNGPLAIRYITKALVQEIPSFQNLSSSKQRRLIMSALELGDKENSVIFEKIGWGQWSAKVVNPNEFEELKTITNMNNLKIKDIMNAVHSQENSNNGNNNSNNNNNNNKRRKSSSSSTSSTASSNQQPVFSSETSSPKSKGVSITVLQVRKQSVSQYAKKLQSLPLNNNQNSKSSDVAVIFDEDEEDEDEDEDEDEEEEEEEEEENLSDSDNRLKTELFSYERRGSTVVYNEVHSDQSRNNSNAWPQKVSFPLKPRIRRMSRKQSVPFITKPSLSNPIYHDSPGTISPPLMVSPLRNLNNKIDLEELFRSTKTEPTSRRGSRVSFSKESCLRTTLIHNNNSNNSNEPPPLLNETMFKTSNISHLDINDTKNEFHHSDTDEEDWASMGAASLRNSALPQKIEVLNCSQTKLDTTENVSISNDNNVATLLMGLKTYF